MHYIEEKKKKTTKNTIYLSEGSRLGSKTPES